MEALMRGEWKAFGRTGLVCVCVMTAVWTVGVVQGDPAAGDQAPREQPPYVPHDESKPYPLGPHAIPFEQAGAETQAAVEAIQETVETSQPASSYAAWSAATAWTGQQAEAEIAARGVGLVGTESDGVVP
jgi:hypothetical protein